MPSACGPYTAAETAPRCSGGTWSAMVAVSPDIAAYMPSWAKTQAPATVSQLPARPVSSSPTTKPATPPATHTRRRPNRLRVRSHSAPNTGRATRAAIPAAPLTRPKSRTLCAASTSSSCRGSSSWTGASWAAHSPSQMNAKRAVQPREGGAATAVASATDRAEHPVEVLVGEHAGRVQPVADGGELAEARIPLAEHAGVQPVQLAPVRSTAHLPGDLLQRGEPRARVGVRGHVRGDVGVGAAGRGQQRVFVGRGQRVLPREGLAPAGGLVGPPQLGEHGGGVGPRHRVLHLQ